MNTLSHFASLSKILFFVNGPNIIVLHCSMLMRSTRTLYSWSLNLHQINKIYAGFMEHKIIKHLFSICKESWMWAKTHHYSFISATYLGKIWIAWLFHMEHCVKSVQIRRFFWSVFSRIRTGYRDLQSKSACSVWVRENTDYKKRRVWTRKNRI